VSNPDMAANCGGDCFAYRDTWPGDWVWSCDSQHQDSTQWPCSKMPNKLEIED